MIALQSLAGTDYILQTEDWIIHTKEKTCSKLNQVSRLADSSITIGDSSRLSGDIMGNINVRVFDLKTNTEITEGIGFTNINDREHVGRKMIHVTQGNRNFNVGILNPDGSTEAQPTFKIETSSSK